MIEVFSEVAPALNQAVQVAVSFGDLVPTSALIEEVRGSGNIARAAHAAALLLERMVANNDLLLRKLST